MLSSTMMHHLYAPNDLQRTTVTGRCYLSPLSLLVRILSLQCLRCHRAARLP
ncbi:hypothetical protein BDR03DRAFT_962359 [Suillus americanus]|nr:hypothetical protein BDR03DRAFT_962359 [Suillus americanus]